MGETKTVKRMGTDFTVGPVMPLLVKFMLPFLLANILNSLYNTVDTIIIGHFVGNTGIVAVSLGGKMLTLFTNIGMAFAGGGQIYISQLTGAKLKDEYNPTIGTLFSEMLAISLVFAAGTLLLSGNILKWLNTPQESYESALAYLRITCLGLPLMFGYTAVSSVLRGMGDSRSPLVFIAIAALFNLIGDLVFIIYFDMGAAGTAIATVMGQGLSLIFSIIVLYRRREHFGFDFRLSSFRIIPEKLKIMLRLGFPTALRFCFVNITQLFMISYVNLFGLTAATAYSVGDKIYNLSNVFVHGGRQAAGAMIGQNIGADKHDRVKTIVRCTAVVTLSSALFFSILSLLFPRFIFGLFTTSADVLAYAPSFMRITCITYFLSSTMAVYESVLIGTGNTFLNFIGGFLDGVALRIALSFLFAYGLNMGVLGFYLGDALTRLGSITVGTIYYYTGAWKRRKKLVDRK